MRYIDKSRRCPEFDNYITSDSPSDWNEFLSDIKLKLHRHLWKEQKGLCVYCEQGIPEKKGLEYRIRSHIEHIRPRSKDEYKHLTFCYTNLSVSCEGFDSRADENPKKEFCEHRKGDEYDEEKFLNPVELPDIEDYFEYDIEGKIFPNSKRNDIDMKKAEYMVKILELNNETLTDMRREQYETVIEDQLDDFGDFLNPDYEILPPFYSMLKQLFGH